MKSQDDRPRPAAELRRQAEEMARKEAAQSSENLESRSPEGIRQTLHELRVHQIELEMQNEELRRTQVELEAARARYFDLYDLAPVGYVTLSEQGLILEANLTAATLLGVTRDDLVKQPISRFICPEAQDSYYRFRQQLFATGAPRACELRMLRADAAPCWARLEATVAQDADGAPGCRVVLSDITARKQAEESLQDKEAILSESQRIAHIGSWRIELASGFISWSEEMYRLYGVAPDTFAHSMASYLALIHPGDVAAVQAWHSACLAGKEPQALDFRIILPDGKVRFIRGSCEVQYDQVGRPFSMVGSAQDITEHKANEERLRQAAAVFENTRESVTMTDAEERILMVNPAFSELTGYAPEEVLGQTPRLLKSGRHDLDFYAAMWTAINATGHWQGEVWNRRKNGEVFPQLLSISAVRDEAGQATHYVGVSADISQRKDAEARLDFLAHHDPLTRLPNRLLLYARLQHGLDVSHREHKRLALLMLDLDRFKDVNDSFGHLVGDELLQQVAERLTVRRRGIDTVTRLGGDEFAVLLEDLRHPQDAAQVASEIIAALSEPFRLSNGAEVRIGASVGISLFPEHGQTLEALLQQADAALYQAKGEGRGNFKYFSDDLTSAARSRINLEALLRRALIRDELRVHYQPQIEITSGRIVGAEALVRWQEPTEGLIPPSRFIRVAEETGLIAAIGEWVLRETCRQGQQWIEAGLPPLNLAVNLSPHQFRHGDISATVAKVLAETSFPAERLELELTESALMEREAEAVEILQRLRALGVRLAIDDFGTGYSSLAYLKRFPLDVLKIDKSFVDDIPRLQDDMEIAAAIVALGHTLRLKVLAEGVETAEQLAFLSAQGCDFYQGYYRSRPVPAAAFVTLLQQEA